MPRNPVTQLSNLALPRNLDLLASFSLADLDSVALTRAQRLAITEALISAIWFLLQDSSYADLPDAAPISHEDPPAIRLQEWSGLIANALIIYDTVLAPLVSARQHRGREAVLQRLDDAKHTIRSALDAQQNPFRFWVGVAFFNYLGFHWTLLNAVRFSIADRVPRAATIALEASAFEWQRRILDVALAFPPGDSVPSFDLLVARLARSCAGSGGRLLMAASSAAQSELRHDTELLAHGFSLAELVDLSERHAAAVAKYGRSHVASEFERQLSLVLQSLGFHVVRAPRAQKLIDLLCFATGPEPFVFLVDAKTTGGSYSLPAADSRAVLDYVGDFRRYWDAPRDLKLVMLVGPRPASTLAAKVKQLEHAAEVPVRFCTAKALALLRANVPGFVSSAHFLHAALDGPPCLSDEFWEPAAQRYRDLQEVKEVSVRRLLAVNQPKGATTNAAGR